jgi:predicted DCC family thiol-disulfide oxidoreductase YuxK
MHFWFEPGPASTLGFCRVVFYGGLLVWQFPIDYAAWGGYSDVLWMPIWLFERFNLPLLSSATLDVMQSVWKLSLLLSAIGLFTRAATLVAFVLGIYLLGLPHNFGQTQHFDALAVFVMGALAISHAGHAWSVDALVSAARRGSRERPEPSGEYTWPLRFVWVAMALIFFAAGFSKLRASGLEWVFSDNLAMLLRRQQYNISDGEPLTNWGIVVAQYPWMAQGLAGASVMVETLFPLALFSRFARLLLIPAALGMLIGIRALMGPTFEQFMICFAFWVPWRQAAAAVCARLRMTPSHVVVYDGACGFCSGSVAVLERLDLLGRLRFANLATEWDWISARCPALEYDACVTNMHVIVRGGTVLRGFDAYRSMAWVLPAAWTLLPILYLPGVPTAGRRVYNAVASRRMRRTCPMPVPGAR